MTRGKKVLNFYIFFRNSSFVLWSVVIIEKNIEADQNKIEDITEDHNIVRVC